MKLIILLLCIPSFLSAQTFTCHNTNHTILKENSFEICYNKESIHFITYNITNTMLNHSSLELYYPELKTTCWYKVKEHGESIARYTNVYTIALVKYNFAYITYIYMHDIGMWAFESYKIPFNSTCIDLNEYIISSEYLDEENIQVFIPEIIEGKVIAIK